MNNKYLKLVSPEIRKELDQKELRQEIRNRLAKLPIDKYRPPMLPVAEELKKWDETPHSVFGVYIYQGNVYFITRIDQKEYYIQTLSGKLMTCDDLDCVMQVIGDKKQIVILTEVNTGKKTEKLIYNWEIFKDTLSEK